MHLSHIGVFYLQAAVDRVVTDRDFLARDLDRAKDALRSLDKSHKRALSSAMTAGDNRDTKRQRTRSPPTASSQAFKPSQANGHVPKSIDRYSNTLLVFDKFQLQNF